MEVSHVRRRVQGAITAARQAAQQHRQQSAEAERSYAAFLETIAIPLVRQLATALKAEGYAFTVFTPGETVRLAADRGRDDFIEIRLDTDARPPQVVARISHARGSRTIDEERPVKPAAGPGDIGEDELLDFLLRALEPWLNR